MYQRFREQLSEFPVVTLQDIKITFPDFDTKNLVNWQKKGYLVKLRNGFYVFRETDIDEYLLYKIANKIYEPSYISLESALSFYGIIPEAVFIIQSVSTRKTKCFETPVGVFNFRTIKHSLYFGYRLISKNGYTFRFASREKAVLDFLYLRPDIKDYAGIEALRWNREELQKLKIEKLSEYLTLYSSATLNEKINLLINYIHD